MKNSIITTVIMLVCIPMLMVMAESFVISPKKKKMPSSKALTESSAELSSDVVRLENSLIACCADSQDFMMDQLELLIDGGKEGFFAKASKDDIVQYHDIVKALKNDLAICKSAINKHMRALRDLEKKVIVP